MLNFDTSINSQIKKDFSPPLNRIPTSPKQNKENQKPERVPTHFHRQVMLQDFNKNLNKQALF